MKFGFSERPTSQVEVKRRDGQDRREEVAEKLTRQAQCSAIIVERYVAGKLVSQSRCRGYGPVGSTCQYCLSTIT